MSNELSPYIKPVPEGPLRVTDGQGLALGGVSAVTAMFCGERTRGTMLRVPGVAGTADRLVICDKNASNVYGWREMGQTALDARYVNVTGDTMTGLLTVSNDAVITGFLEVDNGLNVFAASSLDGALVINESGAAVNTRIESDTNANAILVDGTNNRVGILNASPAVALDVTGEARVSTAGTNAASVVTVGGTQTLTSKTLTSPAVNTPTITAATYAAGTASANTAPIKLQTGALLTTAEIGAVEFLTNTFYITPNASNRAVNAAFHFICQDSALTGNNNNSAQKVFDESTNGTITLPSTTSYFMEGFYYISTTGTSSHFLQLLFGGTATFTSLTYSVMSALAPPTTDTFATPSELHKTDATALAVSNAVTAASHHKIWLRGVIRVNAGGTLIPQYQWNAAPGVASVTNIGSFLRLTVFGTNTTTTTGNWS